MSNDDREHRATVVTTTSVLPPGVTPKPGSPCLVVIYGGELGKRIPLGTETIECGRSMTAQIPLDDDAVSRRHAKVAWTGNAYVVSDLGSTNGTYVNDGLVRERTLQDGDQIKIGRSIFKFLQGGNVEMSYHEEIYRVMTTDGLTQILNKRTFEATLEKEVGRSKRYERALSLVLFDIDHFKRVNDARGHVCGDALLRQFASAIKVQVRRDDVFARVGGEEFALLTPEIPRAIAASVAEKLRGIVERTQFMFENQPIPVTSSFGVAELDRASMGAAELYAAADARLYEAKRSGRNCVR